MDLKNITDDNLIVLAEQNRSVELHTLTQSLHYIMEIDRRRLYAKLKCKSIYEFLTKRLMHSEDEACRRISAMRLLKELPQIEDKVNSGAYSLTTLTQVQTLFRREAKNNRKMSRGEKLDLLEQVEGKSKRATERIVASVSPDIHIPDKIKAVSQTQIMLRYVASDSLEEKISELRDLLAHSHPGISLGELNHWLCDFALAALKSPAPARVKKKNPTAKVMSNAAIRREVWKRDKNKCRNCGSKYALEIDHIKPKAMGGDDSFENLRLLCRNCNQRAAVEIFGQSKMERAMRRKATADG